MTMVDKIMGETTGTASGRPPEMNKEGDSNGNVTGQTPLKTARRLEPYSPRNQRDHGHEDESVDNGRLRSSHYGPSGQQKGANMTTDVRGKSSTDGHLQHPPVPPSLLPVQGAGEAFSVSKTDRIKREEIKLSIEFPLRSGAKGNDISLFFKRFLSALMAANKDILLKKWDSTDENPISRAGDIAYSESEIAEYYAGMRTSNDKRSVVGYTRILSNESFSMTKKGRFREWLIHNKVFVRPTSLSSRKHVKVGWLLMSHPQYTNFRAATRDLKARIGEEVEIELSPHTISHNTTKNTTITTRALKVVTNDEDCGRVLDGLIDALTTTPKEYLASNTAAFKLIPFRNHAIGRDGMTELMTRQNDFLHHTVAISVVNGGSCDQRFEDDGMTLVEMAMEKKAKDGTFMFETVEPGRVGQCNFLCPKYLREEAEEWLDYTFQGILDHYGEEKCREVFGGDNYIRREQKIRTTPKIVTYLKNLNLSVQKRVQETEELLARPPTKRNRQIPRVIFGGDKKSVWNTPLHAVAEGARNIKEFEKKQESAKMKGLNSGGSNEDTVDLTQGSAHSNVSTLEQSLNDEIQKANERRKADAATTKAAISAMEDRLTAKNDEMEKRIKRNSGEMEKRISSRMDDQVVAFQALHEGQVHMEENLRMIMDQIGLGKKKANTKTIEAYDKEKRKEMEATKDSAEDAEMYDDYSISAEQFDAVLTQAEIQRGYRAEDGSPAKKMPKQSSAQDVSEDDL